MTPADIDALAAEAGSTDWNVARQTVLPDNHQLDNMKVLELFTASGLTASNGEAKKLLQSGAIYVNEVKIEDTQKTFTADDFVNGILLLRKGKKTFKVIKQ